MDRLFRGVEKFIERTQNHLNKYIALADQKASILLTDQLAFLGLIATAEYILVNSVNPIFMWLAVATGILGLSASLLSIAVI